MKFGKERERTKKKKSLEALRFSCQKCVHEVCSMYSYYPHHMKRSESTCLLPRNTCAGIKHLLINSIWQAAETWGKSTFWFCLSLNGEFIYTWKWKKRSEYIISGALHMVLGAWCLLKNSWIRWKVTIKENHRFGILCGIKKKKENVEQQHLKWNEISKDDASDGCVSL